MADPCAAAARALGVDFPLVQAGMGGIATPALAAAVSGAGALGTVALYKMEAEGARAVVADTAARTSSTFGVNVIPEVAGDALLRRQVDAALAALPDRRSAVFNTYGLPPRWLAAALRGSPYRLLVQVGSADDAARAAELGAQVIALQGVEAGGHLLGRRGVRDLVAETAPQDLGVPLLAAGGLHDGRQLAELIRLGAGGWLMGTAFIATPESGAHPDYRTALISAGPASTVITDRFDIGWPGRRHRVLRSPVTESRTRLPSSFIAWTDVAGGRQPVFRGSAAAPTAEAQGRVDEMARYAGTGAAWVNTVAPAADLVARIRAEYLAASGGRTIRTDVERPSEGAVSI
ncbi:NAD(P)H-dependent flavin oxidoreductase [Catellatospora tritici]|uniref:NAD(P)H-dependent flavin oxidoreductase n=1 Tax=Catellatospora tritici TaxID=2851566 RepID=UPI001C2D7B1F|nr:nitronate monooxygenase [Catellatospora tritici]MBV1849546.1 nitronate monooxygenase [Catellatospora tritici]